ncbi:MAG: BrnT family toxin [Alphaproteobacteria bacterium]|nr:BrnT family toxin [Alphaproteobacteria bacterium]
MSGFENAAGFDWDDGNRRKNAHKHGVSQAEAEQVFLNEPLLLLEDVRHSQQEPRFHALGQTDAGKLLHITFTLRGGGRLVRVISARLMSRREREVYDKKNKEDSVICF